MGGCFGKCCKSSIPNIRLNIVSSCCKRDDHRVVIHNDEDFEKLKSIIRELNHHESIKISRSRLYTENI